VHGALHRIYQSLLTLKTTEEAKSLVSASVAETPRALLDWRKSITRHTITCLEYGAHLRQLSGRHLRLHGLGAPTYRLKYGILQSQRLAALATTAKQREMLRRIRPWEYTPAFLQSQARRAAEAAPKEAEAPKRKRRVRRKHT
jgi:predicted transcriptional regulator